MPGLTHLLAVASAVGLASSASPAEDDVLARCLSAGNVPYVTNASTDWARYATPYNMRLQWVPRAIALPAGTNDVSSAVLCAREAGVKVQPKSGGHSYASFSSGGVDGILQINLESLYDIKPVDDGFATVEVGPAARVGNLVLELDKAGRGLALGTCAGIGLGGQATHGGFGYSSRAWGLLLDQIVALDAVLANGSVVHADAAQNADVYYAMRGAADSMGIVSRFWFATQAVPPSVVHFDYVFPGAVASVDAIVAAVQHVQAVVQNASVVDRNLGIGMHFQGGTEKGKLQFGVRGTFFGAAAQLNATFLAALLAGLPPPGPDSVYNETDWLGSLEMLAGSPLAQPVRGYDAHLAFYAKSVTVPEPDGLTAASLRAYATYLFATQTVPAPGGWFAMLNLFGGPDSQINNKDMDFAAYSDRRSLWVAQHYGYLPADAASQGPGVAFVDGLNDAMTSELPRYGAYLNYVDPSYSAAEAQELVSRLVDSAYGLAAGDAYST